MKLNISSAKALGNPTEKGWVQVHDFSPEDKTKLKERGRIFALISVKKKEPTDSPLDMVVGGREVLSRLHEEYYGKKEISAFNGLKKAVEKVSSEFSSWGEVQIAAASMVGDVLYTAIVGGGEVSIYRKGSLATILEAREGVAAASGYPKNDDLFILSTKNFFSKVGRGVVTAAFSGRSLEEISERLGGKLHSIENSESDGFVAIKFSSEETLQNLSLKIPEKEEEEEKGQPPKEEKGRFGKLFGRSGFKIRRRKIKTRKREIDVADMQKKKTTFSVSVLVLILLIISIVFGIRQQKLREKESIFDEKITKALHNLEEAGVLFSLSPERSRELFVESQELVKELEEMEFKQDELEEIKKRLAEGKGSVLGEYDVLETLFLDTSPISENFSSDVMVGSGNSIALLDVSGRRVATVSIDTKRTEVVSGPIQISSAKDLALYETRPFILEEDGVYEVGNAKILSVEKTWSENILMSMYAGNLYVLDKESSEITRFPGAGVDFGEGSSWLAPGIAPDLSKIISMAINGSIWILSSSGRVEKYSYGSPETITMSISPPFVNPTRLYTDSDFEFVYILDPGSSRIVVLEKNGEYKAQYINERLEMAENFVVSEEEGVIVFLEGNKLYSFDMIHKK